MGPFNESRSKRIQLLVTLSLISIIVLGLIYPFQSTTLPAWRVRVVDEEAKPVQGVLVRQHWQNYSVESVGHEEDTESDAAGYVSFPPRVLRASLLRRTIRSIMNLGAFQHSSYGPRARIVAWGESSEGSVSFEIGKPLPERITMHRRN